MQKAILFKIKPNKKTIWQNWCQELSTTFREEAILTLNEEKVEHELTLAFSLQNDEFVIGYMDGDCLSSNPNREINIRHQAKRTECLERIGDVEILYNLKSN